LPALKSLAGIGGMGEPQFLKPQIPVCRNALVAAGQPAMHSAGRRRRARNSEAAFPTLAQP